MGARDDLQSSRLTKFKVNSIINKNILVVSDIGFNRYFVQSSFQTFYILIFLRYLLRLVICNRLVNLGISKQQHLYLKTEFNLKTQT